MPMYASQRSTTITPIAEDISARGLSLPSYPALADNDMARVSKALKNAIANSD